MPQLIRGSFCYIWYQRKRAGSNPTSRHYSCHVSIGLTPALVYRDPYRPSPSRLRACGTPGYFRLRVGFASGLVARLDISALSSRICQWVRPELFAPLAGSWRPKLQDLDRAIVPAGLQPQGIFFQGEYLLVAYLHLVFTQLGS